MLFIRHWTFIMIGVITLVLWPIGLALDSSGRKYWLKIGALGLMNFLIVVGAFRLPGSFLDFLLGFFCTILAIIGLNFVVWKWPAESRKDPGA